MSTAFDPFARAFLPLLGVRTISPVVQRYWSDFAAFGHECIAWPYGDGLTPYQEEVLQHVGSDQLRRVAIRKGRGAGGTMVESIAILAFAVTRELAGVNWKIPTTAGSTLQLERYLWPEIRLWARRLKWDVIGMPEWREDRELLKQAIQLTHGEAFATAPTDPRRMEGGHAEQMLLVFDEAASIPSATWDSAEGSMATAIGTREMRWLAVSKPDEADGRFWEIHAKREGHRHWWTRHITLDEAIAAGRVSAEWAALMRKTWPGERNAAYLNHVLGEFSDSGSDRSVIPLWAITAAVERWKVLRDAGVFSRLVVDALGLDVGTGQPGRDPAALARLAGDVAIDVALVRPAAQAQDTEMHLAGELRGRLAGNRIRAGIDANGYGGGTLSRLREDATIRPRVHGFVAGSGSKRRDVSGIFGFANLRAETLWGLREWLIAADSQAALPDEPNLMGELIEPREKGKTSNGAILIESKEDIARRLRKQESRTDQGGSTNRADALAIARWAQQQADDDAVATVLTSFPRPERTAGAF